MIPLREDDGLSLVIPCRNDVAGLGRLLDAIRTCTCPFPVETLVVDDTPGDAASTIARLCDEAGAKLVPGPRNVAAKRNLGAATAIHPLLFFIDADCAPATGTLMAHYEAQRTRNSGPTPLGALAGPTILEGNAATRAWRIAELSDVFTSERWAMPRVDSAVGPWLWPLHYDEIFWATTSNLSVRKSVFLSVGGFDTNTYTVVGGEDVDFCLRLRSAGYIIATVPDAVVYHERKPVSVRDLGQKEFTYGRSNVYNADRNPESAVWFANPIAALGLAAIYSTARRRHARHLMAAIILWWAYFAWRPTKRAGWRYRHYGLISVVFDWAFCAGVAFEGLKQGRPHVVFRRFNYFDPRYFMSQAVIRTAAGSAELMEGASK
jgi:GT2 family glycosyltransferase